MAPRIKEFIYFSGKCKWFRLTPSKYNDWNHQLYLDDVSLELFRKLQSPAMGVSGIQNKLLKDEDGYYIFIRRPTFKEWNKKIVSFTPPEVVDKDDQPWPEDKFLGNGSEIVDKMEMYTYTFNSKKGIALRWEKTMVVDCVPWEPSLPENKEVVVDNDREVVGILASKTRPSSPF